MSAEDTRQVQSCGELSVGDQVEAWHNGKLFHRGEVIRTVAATDLFWMLDEKTGTRRLIDAGALVILRVAVPAGMRRSAAPQAPAAADSSGAPHAPAAAGGAAGQPAAEAPPAKMPASHVPLFQAPSLVP